MNGTLALSVLGASVVGSLHCAGMCGGLVGFYSAGAGGRWSPHLAYQAGRLSAYLSLGALAGYLGRALDLAGEAAGWGRLAGVVGGGLLVGWAVMLLAEAAGQRLPSAPRFTALRRLFGALTARAATARPGSRALGVGLLTGLLPCGLLYSVLLAAASTGGVAGGALVSGALWLGTAPLLLGLGLGAQQLGAKLRSRAPVLTALALLVVGMSSVLQRVPLASAGGATRECCHAR